MIPTSLRIHELFEELKMGYRFVNPPEGKS